MVALLRNDWPRWAEIRTSARKLRKEGVNLLAGRAAMKHMHPFMAAELRGLFKLGKALQIGMIPLVLNSADPNATL